MKKQNRHKYAFMLVWVLSATLSGCISVKPWEREYLADETMYFEPDPLEAGRHLHIQEVREGSRGGYSGVGGGCGCR